MARIKAQESEAWRRFLIVYTPLVLGWCRRAGLQEADAADVSQDVFRTVAQAIDGFEHGRDGGTFRGWLWSITRSRVFDLLRRQEREGRGVGGSEAQAKFLGIADFNPDADDPSDEEDKRKLVRRAIEVILEDCEETTRQAFYRTVVGGQKAADVARELGLSVNAVYVAKSRLLRRIRDEIGEFIET